MPEALAAYESVTVPVERLTGSEATSVINHREDFIPQHLQAGLHHARRRTLWRTCIWRELAKRYGGDVQPLESRW